MTSVEIVRRKERIRPGVMTRCGRRVEPDRTEGLRNPRIGATLIEVLVIISIVSVLLALNLPAIAAARIEVFRRESGERLCAIEDTKCKGQVESLRFACHNTCLIAAGGDHSGFVSVWNAADGRLPAQQKTGNHIQDCTLSAGETTIITIGHEQGAVVKLS